MNGDNPFLPFRSTEVRHPEEDEEEEEEEEILGSDDDEQEDPKDYVKGELVTIYCTDVTSVVL